jgi:hypothetical protein
VGIFVGTSFEFHFSEIDLEMRLGLMGKLMGFVGLCGGATPTKRNKIF